MFIQGHLCTIMQNDPYECSRDLEKVKLSFDYFLKRLQTDYIDVGMIHYVDSFEEYDVIFKGEIIKYAKELKEKGTIHHIGISSHNPLVALKAESARFKKAITITQFCHYCLTRPDASSVLIGLSNKEVLMSALKYTTATDKEKNCTHILSGTKNVKISGRCMYCNHCQPWPSGIDIATVTKFLDLSKEHDFVPDTVRQHYNALSKNASDCIMCGSCEPNCHFIVKVIQNMQAAQNIFGNN